MVAQDGSGDFNGTTHQCIQDAVDFLEDQGIGGLIFIKPGDYVLTQGIVVTGRNIILSGVTGSLFSTGSNLTSTAAITFLDFGGAYGQVSDLGFVGNGVASQIGIEGGGGYQVFDNIYFSGLEDAALDVTDAAYSLIRGCNIFACENGVRVNAASTPLSIIGCIINNGDTADIHLNGATGVLVEGNRIDTSFGTAILLEDATYNNIVGNQMSSCGIGVVETGTSDYNMVASNMWQTSGAAWPTPIN